MPTLLWVRATFIKIDMLVEDSFVTRSNLMDTQKG